MKIKSIFLIIVIIIIMMIFVKKISSKTSNRTIPSAIPVSYMILENSTIDIIEELPGRVIPYKIAEIRPQIGGIIINRLFKEGSNVKQGVALYQIEDSLYRNNYEISRANLLKAEALLKSIQAKTERYKELTEIEAISKQDYDDIQSSLAQARADVALAKAEVNTAKIDLKYTKLFAPISGHIGKSSVTAGALVNANQTNILATITQLDPIYIDLTQSSEDLFKLRKLMQGPKQSVTLTVQNGSYTYSHKGTIEFIDVTVDPTTASVQLRTLFPNPDSELLPGMFVKARINVTLEEALLIPQQASVRKPNGDLEIWLLQNDNTVKSTKIKTIRAIDNNWLVSEGVKDGDKIIIEGTQKISEGSKVDASDISLSSNNNLNKAI